jgi:NADH-quinone oxidoreductase subunit L
MVLGFVFSAPGIGPALWAAAIFGALLTSIYIFRAVFIVFFGPVTTEVSGSYGARIILPIVTLSAAALSIGWLETPHFLGGAATFSDFLAPATGNIPRHAITPLVPLAGICVPLAGLGIAWTLYRNGFWPATALARFLRGGSGFDALYGALFTRPFLSTVAALRQDPVDQSFNLLQRAAIIAHRRLRLTQTGQLRRYAGWLMAGSLATILLLLFG